MSTWSGAAPGPAICRARGSGTNSTPKLPGAGRMSCRLGAGHRYSGEDTTPLTVRRRQKLCCHTWMAAPGRRPACPARCCSASTPVGAAALRYLPLSTSTRSTAGGLPAGSPTTRPANPDVPGTRSGTSATVRTAVAATPGVRAACRAIAAMLPPSTIRSANLYLSNMAW